MIVVSAVAWRSAVSGKTNAGTLRRKYSCSSFMLSLHEWISISCIIWRVFFTRRGDCCGSKICNEPYLLVTYMILLYVDTSCDLSMLFFTWLQRRRHDFRWRKQCRWKEKDCKSRGRMMAMTIKVKKKYKVFSQSFLPNMAAGHLRTLSPIRVRFSESYREMTNGVIHYLPWRH